VPRLLNQAGHLALQLAVSAGQPNVDVEAALEALTALGLSNEELGIGNGDSEMIDPETVAQSA
jgi:hypothetical protein